MWVLLDGGPSRVFSESDVTMMQEDLNVLKVSIPSNAHLYLESFTPINDILFEKQI